MGLVLKQEIAEAVLGRSRGFCERCGTPSHDLALHHRKLRSRGGKDSVTNLVAICHGCHNLSTTSIHLNPKRATETGWMVSAWGDPDLIPITLPDGTQALLKDDGSVELV
jgi:hypothetical protein